MGDILFYCPLSCCQSPPLVFSRACFIGQPILLLCFLRVLCFIGVSVIFISRACFTSLEQGKKVKPLEAGAIALRVFPRRRAWAWDGLPDGTEGLDEAGWLVRLRIPWVYVARCGIMYGFSVAKIRFCWCLALTFLLRWTAICTQRPFLLCLGEVCTTLPA